MSRSVHQVRAAVVLALGLTALVPAVSLAAPNEVFVPCDGSGGGADGLRAAIRRLHEDRGGVVELERGCTYVLTGVDNRTRSGANGLPVVRADIEVTIERADGPLGWVGIGVGDREDRGAAIERRGGPAFRFFEVARGARLSLQFVSLAGGTAPTGGAIRNNGESLDLTYSEITSSAATGPRAQGGAIWSASPVHLRYSHVRGASAVGRTAEGGGIWTGATAHLTYSSVDRSVARATDGDAAGGGIYSRGRVDLAYSDVTQSTASSARRSALGGGIFGPKGVELTYSGVTRNVAAGRPAEGGGVYSPALGVDMTYSSVEGNRPDNCRC